MTRREKVKINGNAEVKKKNRKKPLQEKGQVKSIRCLSDMLFELSKLSPLFFSPYAVKNSEVNEGHKKKKKMEQVIYGSTLKHKVD